MDERQVVRDLVTKLMEAVEASLDDSPAVREALQEIVRNGFEPRLILLADAEARGADAERSADSEEDDGPEDDELAGPASPDEEPERAAMPYELTSTDRVFLRTVRIRPDSG
jgi:hypothetical protein